MGFVIFYLEIMGINGNMVLREVVLGYYYKGKGL